MDFFTININEDAWNIYLTPDDDNVISDEDSAAETHFSNKEIFFRAGDLSLRNVKHELWHVHFGYCYLSDTTDITLEDMEEISAAMFSDKGEKIINKAKEIHEKLLELRSNDEAKT